MPAICRTGELRTIFEKSVRGRRGFIPVQAELPRPDMDVELGIPEKYLRASPPRLPEVSKVDVVRHYTMLANENYSVDSGFYPLGSCTMKYNPKINEDITRFEGFAQIHPYQPETSVQGALRIMYELGQDLCAITGMDEYTLQPAAGAHGELTGLMVAQAYFREHALENPEASKRTKVIVPDSSHGTNPASATFCGFDSLEVPSDERGGLRLGALRELLAGSGDEIAVLMLTNPNTLGVFDENIIEICELVHEQGGLNYCDGANMNAILGIARPGDMGFDIMHLNLHKTFSTPHGGGGPGAGPVGVKHALAPFLPVPSVKKEADGASGIEMYALDYARPKSIGKVRSFYGNFGVMLRAWAYIRHLGPEGLRAVGENAVLNANYLMARLKSHYHLAYDRPCKHEFVLSGRNQMKTGVHTMDIVKRLIDYGFHPPTVYFPLIVKEAMMIEPTETESKETLDAFADALLAIAAEAASDPEKVKGAPWRTRLRRLDDVRASRKPELRWVPE